MKLKPRNSRNALSALRLSFALSLATLLPLLLYGSVPSWWSQRGVLLENAAPDDFAPANQGQLKNIAKAAVAEMDAKLAGGAGDELHQLVASWSTPTSQTNDFAPLNLGQLKKIAKPFYDRLITAGLTSFHPWLLSLDSADDFAVANIGQVKKLFSFDIPLANVIGDPGGDRLAAGESSANLAVEPYSVWIWRDRLSGIPFSDPRQLPELPSVRSVSAGEKHLAILGADGSVWTWGENAEGQLGDGSNNRRTSPALLPDITEIASVKAGARHTVALKIDGSVLAWGSNYYGELGNGDTASSSVPVAVNGLDNIRRVAAGPYRSMALKSDGSVWIWGYDYYSLELGQEVFNLTPVIVPGLTDIVDIAAGYEHGVALKADGTVWIWGSNYANQLGDGSPTFAVQESPIQIPGLPIIIKIASGIDHTLAIASDGNVWAWGKNFQAQLGDGTNEARSTPVQVTGLTDVVAVATASSYSVAMKADGTVWTWGDGATGILPGKNKRVPQQVGIGLLDTNHNGIDDRWELQYFGDLDQSPDQDFDDDGLTNLQEFQRGTDPFDYYNGRSPLIRIITGDQQQGDPDAFAGEALQARVLSPKGKPLANAPVEFILTQGAGRFALSEGENADRTVALLLTDVNGNASVYFRFPHLAGDVSRISVAAPGMSSPSSVNFTLQTSTPPPPIAATEVAAVTNADGKVTVTWIDNSNNEEHFVIEMQNPDGTWQALAAAPANSTSYTTARKAINYRVKAEQYGASAPAPETNPAPVRYAIIDLGVDAKPIRVTNSGYVLCQSSKFGVSPQRWYQGQFQPLIGGVANATVGVRDVHEDGTVVGSIERDSGRVPSPPIGNASQVHGTDAWYRQDRFYQKAAYWKPDSGDAVELAVPAFGFNVGQTPFDVFTGEVSNPSAALAITDSGIIFGEAIVAYRDEPAYIDTAGTPVGTRWGTAASGYNFSLGQPLGDQMLVYEENHFSVRGQPFFILKARGGTTIGSTGDFFAGARYLNNLLRDFQPVNLNSQGNALIRTGGAQPKYQWFETSTETRAEIADVPLVSSAGAANVVALNHRTIKVTDAAGTTTMKLSPQAVGYLGTSSSSSGAAVWEENGQTGKYQIEYLNRFISPNSGWTLEFANDINDNGIIVGTGRYADPSTPQAQPQKRAFMLVPAGLMVDGNRDGEMSFDDRAVRDADQTSEQKPYRFWVNDDQDAGSGINNSEEVTPPQLRDNQDEKIQSVRDCEDLARLRVNIGGLTEGFKTGKIKLVFRFRNVKSGNPALRAFRAVENGGRGYVSNEAWGTLQATPPYDQALPGANGPGIASSTTGIHIDRRFWEGIDESDPTINLLFEGVEEGLGELYLDIIGDGQRIGSSPGVWLDLKNVQKMYERATARPENIDAPYAVQQAFTGPVTIEADPNEHHFAKPWDETDQCVVFVHGWNVSYNEYIGVAQTMFKRLWHQGFKGHLATFRWDTRKSDGMFDAGEFNRSENRAYVYGGALKQWVDRLSETYTVNLVAHSMGNIVAGEALRQGLQIRNYLLMEAAIPMSCYSPDAERLARLEDQDRSHPTPDYHRHPTTSESTLGYRGYISSTTANFVNFYNEGDWALATGTTEIVPGLPHKETNWEKNQIDYKPDGEIPLVPHALSWRYFYDANTPSVVPLAQRAFVDSAASRYVSDSWEMKAFVARSRTKAVGAFRGGGSLGPSENLRDFGFRNVRPDHSGQFTRNIQTVDTLYKRLRERTEE